MNLSEYITVFNNIFKNFIFLRSDFIGISISANGIANFFINLLISLIFICTYYRIGRKIRFYFFEDRYKSFDNFIDIALGYIFVNTGLGILGIFSLLYNEILWVYISLILIIAFFPYFQIKRHKNVANDLLNTLRINIGNNKLIFLGVLLFVLVAFLRLIPPEIGEDAIGYHTGDPHLFLKNHSTLIPPKTPPYVMPAPHLGEMSYMVSELIGFKDSTRYIHFSFYFIVALLLISINPYAALFFVTAPVVIQISSKANVDFQWIICWILSIYILSKSDIWKIKDFALMGILFGGVLATKLWTVAFLPLFILYILLFNRKLSLANKIKAISVFFFSTVVVDFIWILRSYLVSGDPVYPGGGLLKFGTIIGFNNLMFTMQNISVFSPVLYFGIAIIIFNWRHMLTFLQKYNLSIFFALLTLEYLVIKYHFGRYLLGLYSIAVIVVATGVENIIKKSYIYRIIIFIIFGGMFTYYFLNTLLILPYGFGWADSNKYLTRIIFRDNANYYDFDHQFDKWISNKDKVVTYGIYGHYYANFDYVDANYIFDKSNKSFDLLLKNNATKLFIKGGDWLWFCEELDLQGCNIGKVKLLAKYPDGLGRYYLYSINSVKEIAIR